MYVCFQAEWMPLTGRPEPDAAGLGAAQFETFDTRRQVVDNRAASAKIEPLLEVRSLPKHRKAGPMQHCTGETPPSSINWKENR
jgi:hypothetical protein